MTERFYKALCYAIEAHDGQHDKGGLPYILHPLYLAQQADDEDEQIVLLFHDVVEDTVFSLADIACWGYPELVEPIDCITKRKDETYETYMTRVQSNLISLKAKIKDMRHNSDISRLAKIGDKERQMIAKYNKWLPVLEEKLRTWPA